MNYSRNTQKRKKKEDKIAMKEEKNWKEEHYNCIKHKSLRSVLHYKFLNEYGFEKGPVVVGAIVEDILSLVNQFYCKKDILGPGRMLWFVVDKGDRPTRGKTYAQTKLVPVILTIVAEEDFLAFKEGTPLSEIRKQRIINWFFEAYKQGGLMTTLDASMLTGREETSISEIVRKYQQQTGQVVPTRGNVHDIGPGITHKSKVIELYLKRYLTPEIAQMTSHSRQAVDRYIQGFERVKMLVGKFPEEEIPHLAQMSKPLVNQYLELIPEEDKKENKSVALSKNKP